MKEVYERIKSEVNGRILTISELDNENHIRATNINVILVAV